jgi:predicted metal-dependent phosphoesterase TrpH
MKYDLHTHSKYSNDGWMEIETMVKAAMARGLSGIAVTDHNTIKGGLEAQKFSGDDFEVIIGSEITTDRGEVIGLYLSDEILSNQYLEVIDEIKDQDGLVLAPHPFDSLRGNGIKPDENDVNLIDLVEILNARCFNTEYNEKAARYAEKYKLKVFAGSDAHFSWELGNAGVEIKGYDLRKALDHGDLSIFGQKSSFVNIGLTKAVKIWRKTNFG